MDWGAFGAWFWRGDHVWRAVKGLLYAPDGPVLSGGAQRRLFKPLHRAPLDGRCDGVPCPCRNAFSRGPDPCAASGSCSRGGHAQADAGRPHGGHPSPRFGRDRTSLPDIQRTARSSGAGYHFGHAGLTLRPKTVPHKRLSPGPVFCAPEPRRSRVEPIFFRAPFKRDKVSKTEQNATAVRGKAATSGLALRPDHLHIP